MSKMIFRNWYLASWYLKLRWYFRIYILNLAILHVQLEFRSRLWFESIKSALKKNFAIRIKNYGSATTGWLTPIWKLSSWTYFFFEVNLYLRKFLLIKGNLKRDVWWRCYLWLKYILWFIKCLQIIYELTFCV